jgi:tight adherence protein B
MVSNGRYSEHSVLLEADLHDYIFFGAFGLTILFGTARSLMLVAEQRRKSLRHRLAAISAVTQPDRNLSSPLTLRRAPLKRRLRSFYLLPTDLSARLDVALAATGNRIGVSHLISTAIVAAAAVIAFALMAAQCPSGLAIALGGVAAFGGPALLLRLAQSRYQRRFLDVFPDALDLIVRAVRVGLPALEAIDLSIREIAAPVCTEFQRMLDEMRVGVEVEDALQETADRIRVPDFRFFVVCLVLQRRTGGGLADTLSNLSTLIRQRRAVRLRARALAAETKASAVVVAMMPLIAGAGLFFINPQMMSTLLVDPRGRFMLGVAVFSLFLGITMMIVIIRKGSR